ncbi:SH3 domain-containing protein [Leptospira andrefontaineae]|uniref:SH3 domain-containing protein n=1 Tax=Leptospira andrefontaineae TaxID=2484976 RepID=UPI00142E05DD|nr:SH3 domain-containing protein [Leptospira andrefontaineae]
MALREDPNSASQLITMIPFQAKIQLLHVKKGGTENLDSKIGRWAKVKFDDHIGWTFDHHLSKNFPEIIELAFDKKVVEKMAIDELRKRNQDFADRFIKSGPFFGSRVVKDCVKKDMKIVLVGFEGSDENSIVSCKVVVFLQANDITYPIAILNKEADIGFCLNDALRDRDSNASECKE